VNVEEKFRMFTENLKTLDPSTANKQQIKDDAYRLFKTLANLLKNYEYEFSDSPNSVVLTEIAIPFIQRNIENLCENLVIFSEFSGLVTLFAVALKSIFKITGPAIDNYYDVIVQSILKAFQTSPKSNFSLLLSLSHLFFFFEHSNKQKEWMLQNFSDLDNFLLNYCIQNRDKDIIMKWIEILNKVFEIYRDFFFSLPELENLIQFFLTVFAESEEYHFLRSVGLFLGFLIGTKETIHHPTIAKYVPQIFKLCLVKMLSFDGYKLVLVIVDFIKLIF